MLVLSRKRNETLTIGNAEVQVLGIYGDTIRIGITAPAEVKIARGELIRRGLVRKVDELFFENDAFRENRGVLESE